MELGNHISLPQVPDLGLGALEVDLPTSALRREVKIYKVPESVSSDQYFVTATEAGGAEVVPPSRSRDNLLLARYTLAPDGEAQIHFIRQEVRDA